MAHVDQKYNKLALAVLNDGYAYNDKSRNNIELQQIPTYLLDIDMTKGFPLLTTKKIYWKTIVHELIWMLSGSENIDYLIANKVNIWTEDVFNYSSGTHAGRIYGAQWRYWTGPGGPIDQVRRLIAESKKDLYTRRHLVTAWNPAELDKMALPPCHWAFEILPTKKGFGIKWHQRSCDTFLGIPFDIGLYATLGSLLSREINVPFTRLWGDLSCVHFYGPHIELIQKQLLVDQDQNECQLSLNPEADFDNLHIDDFTIINYNPAAPIKGKLFTKAV